MTYLKGARRGSAISHQNGYLIMETLQKSNNETSLNILATFHCLQKDSLGQNWKLFRHC